MTDEVFTAEVRFVDGKSKLFYKTVKQGFKRLDDGTPVYFNVNTKGEETTYPVEEICGFGRWGDFKC